MTVADNQPEPPYTHQQLWELAWKWWDLTEDEVDAGAALSLKYCADQLTELLGPLELP